MRRLFLTYILTILLLSLPVGVGATNYYVDTGIGNDTYDGLSPTDDGGGVGPWATLGKAASTVPVGAHTVTVAAGAYAESTTETTSGSGVGSELHYLANGVVTTTYFQLSGDYIKLEGFSFFGAAGHGSYGSITIVGDYNIVESCIVGPTPTLRPGVAIWTDSTYNTVTKCTLSYFEGTGIKFLVGSTNHTITHNDISHAIDGDYGDDANGINLKGSGHYIAFNYIHDILYTDPQHTNPNLHIDGIQWDYTDEVMTGVVIEYNHIKLWQEADSANNTCYGIIFGGGDGVIIRSNLIESWGGYHTGGSGTPEAIKLWNNTIISSLTWTNVYYGAGIHLNDGDGHEIKNNIIVDFDFATREADHILISGGATYTAYSNLLWNSDSSVADHSGYTSDGGDLHEIDPKFTDLGGRVYTLKPNSPARHGAFYLVGYEAKWRPESPLPPNTVTTMSDILSFGVYGIYRGSAGM